MHRRLGHVSERGMLELEKQGLFGKDNLGKLTFCEQCVVGKAAKLKFKRATQTTSGPLNYVHSDLWGPSRTTTIGGARYFISITMIFLEKSGFMFSRQKVRHFSSSKTGKLWLRYKLEERLKS